MAADEAPREDRAVAAPKVSSDAEGFIFLDLSIQENEVCFF
jgi:hypothetical protein